MDALFAEFTATSLLDNVMTILIVLIGPGLLFVARRFIGYALKDGGGHIDFDFGPGHKEYDRLDATTPGYDFEGTWREGWYGKAKM